MKVFSRSEWTSQYPQSTTGTEDMDGPPFFRDKDVTGISLFTPNEQALFVELNPFSFLETMRKADYTQRGFGDISFNLGVAQNVEGVFCLRGLCNKSPVHKDKRTNNTNVSVLVLIGSEEPPTDLLLQNLISCRDLVLSRYPNATQTGISTLPFSDFWEQPVPSVSSQFVNDLPTAFTSETGVHVFNWIEQLAYWGYYKGRNDGVYGPVTTNATAMLQADLRDANLYMKRVDGVYGRYTREAFGLYLKSLK